LSPRLTDITDVAPALESHSHLPFIAGLQDASHLGGSAHLRRYGRVESLVDSGVIHRISGGVKWRQTTVKNRPSLKSTIVAKLKIIVALVFDRNLSPHDEH
jgi:hypothetical protein